MPRQLPWLTKPTPTRPSEHIHRPHKRPRNSSSGDDDFYAGTVLSTSRNLRLKPKPSPQASDNELPIVSPSPHRLPRNDDHPRYSSPPPISPLSLPPEISPMRTAASRFDLRDDGWMMVEDELLDTAKGLTRHLHIAEYERLKESIERKRSEMRTKTERCVGRGRLWVGEESKESEESTCEESEGEWGGEASEAPEDADEVVRHKSVRKDTATARTASTSKYTATPKVLQRTIPTHLKPLPRSTAAPVPMPSFPNPTTSAKRSRNLTSTVHKPRTLPFDMLDDYIPSVPATAAKSTLRQPSIARLPAASTPTLHDPTQISTPLRTAKSSTNTYYLDDWDVKRKQREEGNVKRGVERKQDRGEEGRSAKKTVELSEMPTFLF